MSKLPKWVMRSWRTNRRLRHPLRSVPAGAVVIVMIAVPDGRDEGSFDGRLWTCPGAGAESEEARQEVVEMVREFLGDIMPATARPPSAL